jgi:hypothetical protein
MMNFMSTQNATGYWRREPKSHWGLQAALVRAVAGLRGACGTGAMRRSRLTAVARQVRAGK